MDRVLLVLFFIDLTISATLACLIWRAQSTIETNLRLTCTNYTRLNPGAPIPVQCHDRIIVRRLP